MKEDKKVVPALQLGEIGTVGLTVQEDYRNAEFISSQIPIEEPKRVDFDLNKDVDLTVAREVKQNLKNEQEKQKAEENMKTWRMQLSTVESRTEQIMIAMEFELDVLIEALQRNVERVDDIYLLFCKKEDRKPMHSDALKKIKEDMESEYEEVTPYIKEAEDFKNKMM